jgi:small-conductance mechanosensitive channel
MSRRAQENLVAAILLAIFAGVIALSLEFGPRARMIPLPLAVFGMVLTLLQIVWQNAGSTDVLQMDLISVAGRTAARESDAGKAADRRPSWHREAGAFGIVGALLSLILLAGPVPAVLAFTGGYFMVTRQYSWLVSLIYTVVFTLVVYLLFFVVLQIQPYHGLLAPLIARFD